MLRLYVNIIFLFIIGFLLQVGAAFAQPSKVNTLKLYKKAEERFNAGDYNKAMELYKQLYDIDSSDVEANYKLGVCYYEIKEYRKMALKHFMKAKGYDNNELRNYLAASYQALGNYDKALENYYAYQTANDEKTRSYQQINDQIAKCLYAKYAETHPRADIRIESLGDSINTEYAEYVPLIPADESFLVFTSKRKGSGGEKSTYGYYTEDIFISKNINNHWTVPKGISMNINTAGNDACTGLSSDGQKMIIYRSNDTLIKGNFYTSGYNGLDWSIPVLLDVEINSPDFIETSACYSPDGEIIFFSSDRPGGYGGKDIYMSKKLPNGKWGKPFNLGPNINTVYNEDAPFVHSKGNILLFSSQGHVNNMGGYDIFQSSYDPETGKFSECETVGYPINTRNDDIFFVLNTNSTIGYFSSEREEGKGESDIYKATFLSESANYVVISCILQDETGKPITGKVVELADVGDKKTYLYKSNDITGKFVIIIEAKRKYELRIAADNFKPYNENFIYENGVQDKKIILKKR